MKKVFFIISLITFILIANINSIYAINDVSGIIDGISQTTPINNKISLIGNSALDIATVVGVGIAFAMIIFAGIKLMGAAPSEKADVKKQLIPLLIGAVCIFGATFVVNLLAGFAGELFK